MSYDEPEALADFAAAHGITYPLLSDPSSAIIRRVGILNTLIEPDDHPWYGIPFPGSYILDRYGIVTDKFFAANLAIRPGWATLLRAALGEEIEPPAPAANPEGEVEMSVGVAADELAPGVVHELVVRLAVPAGQYLHAAPAVDDLVGVSLTLDTADSGLIIRNVRAPAPSERVVAGRRLPVHDGSLSLVVPITHNGSVTTVVDGRRMVTIRGSVQWQACDADGSGVPRRRHFELVMPAGVNPLPDIGRADGPGHRPMNGDVHFERLRTRHLERAPNPTG